MTMREIVLIPGDQQVFRSPVKATGLFEIGAVELYNHMPNGAHISWKYIIPQRSMPASRKRFEVHGWVHEFSA